MVTKMSTKHTTPSQLINFGMSWRFQLVRLPALRHPEQNQLVTHDSLAVWAGYMRAVRPNFLIGWKGSKLSFIK